MRHYISILILLFSLVLNSQNEANNWFFGNKVGLRFDGIAKPALQFGELKTFEGCASISDSDGNLLFYSDGSTVWSRNHQIMPNGTNLLGDESSTQSAIIVPHPTQTNIYFLFTVGSSQIPSGFHYYTIDMTLNGGMGDVTGTAVDLSGNSNAFEWSEKITAVNGDTCNTVWVISLIHNLFYAYKIDENGVNLTPIISTVNFLASRLSRGYLKVSPDGKKLAVAHQGLNGSDHGLYLYNFNNATGDVTDNNITLFDNSVQTYGVEFSSKSTKLYASTINDDEYKLYQFDLTSNNIRNSAVLIHSEQPAYRGALQLGPDYKIYVTIPETYEIGANYLDVIHSPELTGPACNFEQDYIYFGGDNLVTQGLPPFIQSFFYENEINIINPTEPLTAFSSNLELCIDSTYTLEGEDIAGADYHWTFFDGFRTVDLPTPTPANKLTINTNGDNRIGTYKLNITTNDECNTILIGVATVSFTNPPSINSPAIVTSCDVFDSDSNDGLTTFNLHESISDIVSGFANDFDVLFYLNDSNAINDIHNENSLPQFYANTTPNQIITTKVFVKNSNCYSLGELQLIANSGQNLNAIDMSGCDINNSGLYLFDLYEQLNSIISINALPDNIDIQFFQSIEDAVNKENPLGSSFESGDNLIYFYASTNGVCYGSGSFNLTINPLPPIDTNVEILSFCSEEFPVALGPSIPSNDINNYNFIWSSGEISNTILIYYPQTVSVRVENKNTLCHVTKTYIIEQLYPPIISGIEVNINNRTATILTTENLDNLYALDDSVNGFQSENVFSNVPPGEHTLYVKNKNGCNITERVFLVLGFPKFFTPNNDSFNDYWQLKGVDLNKYSISNIHIFNRYGKLLKVLSPESKWDGTFNGKTLPSSDYWFFVDIKDKNNTVKTYKGHFTISQ